MKFGPQWILPRFFHENTIPQNNWFSVLETWWKMGFYVENLFPFTNTSTQIKHYQKHNKLKANKAVKQTDARQIRNARIHRHMSFTNTNTQTNRHTHTITHTGEHKLNFAITPAIAFVTQFSYFPSDTHRPTEQIQTDTFRKWMRKICSFAFEN